MSTGAEEEERVPEAGGGGTPAGGEQVPVGPFRVLDATYEQTVQAVVDGAVATAGRRPSLAFALHVGGLNTAADEAFVAAMAAADVVYADGASVVLLARLAGAARLERASTTDLGGAVLARLGPALGRRVRVATVGGPPGLAEDAGRVLERDLGIELVLSEHGYQDDWSPALDRLRASHPDVVVVGLGAPREMVWVAQHRGVLPPGLVLTCGGWFGFLVETEARAPAWMQRAGLEWTYRLRQAPARLAGRYARGAVTTARLAAPLVLTRARRAVIHSTH